jgi:hypothetical protein
VDADKICKGVAEKFAKAEGRKLLQRAKARNRKAVLRKFLQIFANFHKIP